MFLACKQMRETHTRRVRKQRCLTLYSVSLVISILLIVYIILSIATNSSLVVVVVVDGVSQTKGNKEDEEETPSEMISYDVHQRHGQDRLGLSQQWRRKIW
jgi:hypothetical protein